MMKYSPSKDLERYLNNEGIFGSKCHDFLEFIDGATDTQINFTSRSLFNVHGEIGAGKEVFMTFNINPIFKKNEIESTIGYLVSEYLKTTVHEDVNKPVHIYNVLNEDIEITIDKGAASSEMVADLLSNISLLYRLDGGSGINFETVNISSPEKVEI